MHKRPRNPVRISASCTRLAKKMLTVLRLWRVGGSVSRNLLGITKHEWREIKRGGALPLRARTVFAAKDILSINHALLIIFNGNTQQLCRWLHSPNEGPPFKGKPAIYSMQFGLAELCAVRSYVQYHANGGW